MAIDSQTKRRSVFSSTLLSPMPVPDGTIGVLDRMHVTGIYAGLSPPLVIQVTGVAATGQVGSVLVLLDALVSLTGLLATGSVGNVTVIFGSTISVTGLSATGQLGTIQIWGDVGTGQTATWVDITKAQ